jgi:hypothetical protein
MIHFLGKTSQKSYFSMCDSFSQSGISIVMGILGHRGLWWIQSKSGLWMHGEGNPETTLGLESWWMPWMTSVLKGLGIKWEDISSLEYVIPWNSVTGSYALKSSFNGLKQWIPMKCQEKTWLDLFERWYDGYLAYDSSMNLQTSFVLTDVKKKIHILSYESPGHWEEKVSPEENHIKDLSDTWGDREAHRIYKSKLLPFI